MIQPNVLSYQRWLDMYVAPAITLKVTFGRLGDGRSAGLPREHEYRLDLSSGSYAVDARAYAKQLTPERWFDAVRSGSRDTGSVEPAEWELAGAL